MAQPRGHVTGSHDAHQIDFYGISTCIWCRKTRNFLEEHDLTFDFTYIDLLHGEERNEVKDYVQQWNSAVSFPTIVIDDNKAIVGYKTDALKEALEL